MNKTNLGKFFLSERLLDDPEAALVFFEGMVVRSAEHKFSSRKTMYVAYGDQFAPVGSMEVIPEYEPVFDAGSAKPRWVRK